MNGNMSFPHRLALSATAAVTVAAAVFLTLPTTAIAGEPDCVPRQFFPAVAVQPGNPVRVSVTDTGQHGEAPVWGIRVRNAAGKIVASEEVAPPPGGSASLQYVAPFNTAGDPRHNYDPIWFEIVLLKGESEDCSAPLTSVQAFDKDGRTAFILAEWPPNPFNEVVPPTPQ